MSEPSKAGGGLVRADGEGERLVHFRDGGRVVIKAGSENMAIGTQQVKAGAGIPVHRHRRTEECFRVLAGSGTIFIGEADQALEQGATVFIPKNTWHGFSNPKEELLLLWVVSPPGLDSFFRETCSRPGEPPKGLAPEQIRRIALKYDTEYR